MNLKDYPALAMQTCIFRDTKFDCEHATIGMITEAGEFADAIKRQMVYGKVLDIVNLKEEAGDCLWYAALLAQTAGFDVTKDCRHWIVEDGGDASVLTDFDLVVALCGAAVACAACIDLNDVDLPVMFGRFMGSLQVVSDRWSFTMEDAAEANLAKLQKRYPERVFSSERALNRDLEGEREVLEGGALAADAAVQVGAEGHVAGFGVTALEAA